MSTSEVLPSGVEQIRKATAQDREEIIHLIQRSFNHRTPELFWHMYGPQYFQADTWTIAIAQGRIVGSVAFPRYTYQRPQFRLPWAGGTGVAVAEEWRSKGIMTSLLERAIAELDKEGPPISFLRGNRLRYGHFGYELAGRQLALRLSKRQCKDPGWKSDEVVDMLGIGANSDHPSDVLERILSIQRKYEGCQLRSGLEQEAIMSRLGVHTLLVEGSGVAAYMMVGDDQGVRLAAGMEGERNSTKVYEVVGNTDLALELLGYVARDNPVTMLISPEMNSLHREVFRKADGFQIVNTGNIRIHKLAATLEAYRPWWAKQELQGSGEVILQLYDELVPSNSPVESVAIQWDSNSVEVNSNVSSRSRRSSVSTIRAERKALTQAVFGPLDPVEALGFQQGTALLRNLFPLPFSVPRLDQV